MIDGVIDKMSGLGLAGKVLVLGCSGGVDSMVLLNVLSGLREELGFELVVAHLDHCLRGEDSRRDYAFVEAECVRLGVEFRGRRVEVSEMAGNLEENGRKARYSFFREILNEKGSGFVVTAHHRDDSVETFLMNLYRGSSLRGLIGIRFLRGDLLRPFFDISKSQILDFARDNNIEFCEDVTNRDVRFWRNMVRGKVLPELRNKCHNFDFLVSELQQNLNEIEGFMTTKFEAFFGGLGEFFVDLKKFNNLSLYQKIDLLSRLYEQIYSSLVGLSYVHMLRICDFFLRNVSGGRVEFGDEGFLVIENDGFRFVYNFELDGEVAPLTLVGFGCENAFGSNLFVADFLGENELPNYDAKSVYVNFSKLGGGILRVRSWLAGDRFRPLGMKGEKKLQDFFVDSKIPKLKRSGIPIFVDGDGRIVAVGNLAISDYFRVDKNTQRILKIDFS